ncbi:MAG: hypothetical protein AAF441_21605 [Pseudomonadota bacterium]
MNVHPEHASSPEWPQVPLRPPEQVMRLDRMGSFFASRLSFMRTLVLQMARDGWTFDCPVREIDENGFGHLVMRARGDDATFSLVVVTEYLKPEERTDRVIAEKWDASFALVDGEATADDIARLKKNIPFQEAGRYTARDLVLSRANKSVRLFNYVADELAAGRQPDMSQLMQTGYLMRTTAVYGNGKFGLADYPKASAHRLLKGPFRAEMLTVYLIRLVSFLLVNHVARARGGAAAVELSDAHCRALGIGNSTGLGMAPFLIKHPILIHNWISARETALARVRAVETPSADEIGRFGELLKRARRHVAIWEVDDEIQMARINVLRGELDTLASDLHAGDLLQDTSPWDVLFRRIEEDMSLEAQELIASLLIELYPERVDELTAGMSTANIEHTQPSQKVGDLKAQIAAGYDWALRTDFNDPSERRFFWYYSEGKEEPRRGPRIEEVGPGQEMRLDFGYQISRLSEELKSWNNDTSIAEFLMRRPEWRSAVRRIQTLAHYPFGEIRDNLIGERCRPIDLLRCKLSFFGATGFDPRSDLWTRITMYQGAPLPHQLGGAGADDWSFPAPGSQ